MSERTWNVYLSGEIHSDWRERIESGVAARPSYFPQWGAQAAAATATGEP